MNKQTLFSTSNKSVVKSKHINEFNKRDGKEITFIKEVYETLENN